MCDVPLSGLAKSLNSRFVKSLNTYFYQDSYPKSNYLKLVWLLKNWD